MPIRVFFHHCLIVAFALLSFSTSALAHDLQTVKDLELKSYAGLWYEMARLPNRFQDKNKTNPCYSTTANYELNENGTIDVINTCFYLDENKVEQKSQAKAVAFKESESSSSKLKVNFVPLIKNISWLRGIFSGKYWVLGLGPTNSDDLYSWAVVVSPSDDLKNIKYAWILSRDPNFANSESYELAAKLLQEKGVDLSQLRKSFTP